MKDDSDVDEEKGFFMEILFDLLIFGTVVVMGLMLIRVLKGPSVYDSLNGIFVIGIDVIFVLLLAPAGQVGTQRGQRNRQRQEEPAQHTAAMLLQRRRRADRQHRGTSFPKGGTVGWFQSVTI